MRCQLVLLLAYVREHLIGERRERGREGEGEREGERERGRGGERREREGERERGRGGEREREGVGSRERGSRE